MEVLEIFLHEEGYYVVRFQSKEDMKSIFHARLYTVNNKHIILKPWSPDFDLNEEFLTESPYGLDSLNSLCDVGDSTLLVRFLVLLEPLSLQTSAPLNKLGFVLREC